MSDFNWGKIQASKAFNKFREGSVRKSRLIMKGGIKILLDSIKESLDKEGIFASLAGLSDFWNSIAGSEITSERLDSMPKEFRTVLSREKIIARQKVIIPDEFKLVLKKLKEIIHVGELLHKKESKEDLTRFIKNSKILLNECEAELKQLQ